MQPKDGTMPQNSPDPDERSEPRSNAESHAPTREMRRFGRHIDCAPSRGTPQLADDRVPHGRGVRRG